MKRAKIMTLRKELIDELMQDYQKPEDLLGENGILKQLTKSLLEHALDGELTYHVVNKSLLGNKLLKSILKIQSIIHLF